jgi:serine/threonine-protein kinase RsbT
VPVEKAETVGARSAEDVVRVRQSVRAHAAAAGLSLVDQTKIITAASELARNMVDYGGGGIVRLEIVNDGRKRGLRVTFEDKGPGIPDVELAMKDGYTTGGGLGLGISGAKRLSNEFSIRSVVGEGTTIIITRWK